jgi:pimeloyl-ACP methyl ester carboxylesterase
MRSRNNSFALIAFLLAICAVFTSAAQAATVVYVHGFGGANFKPQFSTNLLQFFNRQAPGNRVVSYVWDSPAVGLLDILTRDPEDNIWKWHAAKRMADQESRGLQRLIADLERTGETYYIVGHSLGTRVVLGAIESNPYQMRNLRGVYFLASALPNTASLSQRGRQVLPPGLMINSIGSPDFDQVLKDLYVVAEGRHAPRAGGSTGFRDRSLFINMPVDLRHTQYHRLAEAIGADCLEREYHR